MTAQNYYYTGIDYREVKMVRPKKEDEKFEKTNVYLPKELLQQSIDQAEVETISFSHFVRKCIVSYFLRLSDKIIR
jgi:hypothetical protein